MSKKEMDNYMKQLATHIYKREHDEYKSAKEEQHVFPGNFFETHHTCHDSQIKKQKKQFVYRLSTACAGILLVIGIVLGVWYANSNHVVAGEIDYNLEKLSRLDLQTITSSNPYAYKDAENYNNIVNMGPIAIEILEEKYKNDEIGGINAYLAGAAIGDISGINMWDITGQHWSTAEEFFTAWGNMVSNIPQKFKEITESDNDVGAKIDLLEAYGIYGKFYLQFVEKQEKNNISFLGCKIKVETIRGQGGIDNKLSDDDYMIIKKYLEKNVK